MIWNMIYNAIFDGLWPADRVKRRLPLRMAHALGFEGGFIFIGLPLAAWMLNITLWQALVVEIGFSCSSCLIPWHITGATIFCAGALFAGALSTPAACRRIPACADARAPAGCTAASRGVSVSAAMSL